MKAMALHPKPLRKEAEFPKIAKDFSESAKKGRAADPYRWDEEGNLILPAEWSDPGFAADYAASEAAAEKEARSREFRGLGLVWLAYLILIGAGAYWGLPRLFSVYFF